MANNKSDHVPMGKAIIIICSVILGIIVILGFLVWVAFFSSVNNIGSNEKIGPESNEAIAKMIVGGTWYGNIVYITLDDLIRTNYTFKENGEYIIDERIVILYRGEHSASDTQEKGTYTIKNGYIYLNAENGKEQELSISFIRENDTVLTNRIMIRYEEYERK